MTAPGEAGSSSWRRNGAWAAAAGLPVGTGQVEANKGLPWWPSHACMPAPPRQGCLLRKLTVPKPVMVTFLPAATGSAARVVK